MSAAEVVAPNTSTSTDFVVPGGSAILSRWAQLMRQRLALYLELSKPRIATLVLITVALGGLAAGAGWNQLGLLFNTIVGTALVAASASVFNQVLERRADARMPRTAHRPIPSGRCHPQEAAKLAAALLGAGVMYLILLSHWWALTLAVASFLLYVFVYTPLKTKSWTNTIVGAIPGALPAMIGYAAVAGQVDASAWSLFLIVFVWQFPHFFAIAWMYQDDYRQGGMKMLPNSPLGKRLTPMVVLITALLMVPTVLWPWSLGLAGKVYLMVSLLAVVWFSWLAWRFVQRADRTRARGVLLGSLLVLPIILFALVADRGTPSADGTWNGPSWVSVMRPGGAG